MINYKSQKILNLTIARVRNAKYMDSSLNSLIITLIGKVTVVFDDYLRKLYPEFNF